MAMAVRLHKELLVLILQLCKEENLKKTAHMLEQETACFFDMNYFEELLLAGNYNEAEEYLSGFISVEVNRFSKKIYFEIRKQKFLEALDEHDHAKALDILLKDLKVFESSNKELIREMTELLSLDDLRKHPQLARYRDTISARKDMITEVQVVIRATPQFQGKLQFPHVEQSRLRHLVNQSLNWQHIHCANRSLQPQLETLFLDHRCPEPDPSNELLNHMDTLILSEGESPFGDNSTSRSCITETEPNLSAETLSVVSNIQGAKADGIKISGDSTEEKGSSETSLDQSLKFSLTGDFPKNVERVLDMAFPPTSMDFHPVHEMLLLVGNTIGDIELWDVCVPKRVIWIKFDDWKFKTASLSFWGLEKDSNVSVSRILWSPDGALIGVAYSKNIVQLYCLNSNHRADKQLEIDAHVGNVYDLAFSKPYDKLLIITCGEDKYIQGWDAVTGVKKYTFQGHSGPVYSLCPHVKEGISFLFSTSTSGEIKAWIYDSMEPIVSFDAPGYSCVRMAYCGDGKRLFSCGTNTNGESSIVEWKDDEIVILRTYLGLSQHSSTIVRFGIIKNRYLIVLDGALVKVWNIDDAENFSVLDVGDLDSNSSICFTKKGTLIAVATNQNKIKILADEDGRQVLQSFTFPLPVGSSTESFNKERDGNPEDDTGAPGPMTNDTVLKSQSLSKIVEISSCRTLSLPSEFKSFMICRLLYTKAGDGIVALLENGIHSLWRWPKTCPDSSREATTERAPQLCQPNGLLMMNYVRISSSPSSSSSYSPCFALSNNDCYLLSASGGTVNLFNAVASKKMRSLTALPPEATCIAIYPPDNNIIAVGLADATIFIYNVRIGKILSELQGHSGKISGLAFSVAPVMLVSAGTDDQIILWDPNDWVKIKSTTLQIPADLPKSETYLEFHKDQHCFLVVNESQLTIYETATLQLLKQWMMGSFCARISHATFSCDNVMIYVVLKDGIILILSAEDMTPRFEIDPSTYLPPEFVSHIYPTVIAAHPRKPCQIAVGTTDGGVIIIEPHDPCGNWRLELDGKYLILNGGK